MRARRGLLIGWLLVGLYAAALLVATLTTDDADLEPGDRGRDEEAAAAFVVAWERARQATFVRTGTFERRSEEAEAAVIRGRPVDEHERRTLAAAPERDPRPGARCDVP